MAKELKELTSRSEDYSQWYLDLVIKAELAENSAVRGCMVIKPYGYAIWEKMQRQLDDMFKETGHVNAYFPLFIPKSFLSREADHVEGFAKECAVVTHYRLKNAPDGSGVVVDPEAKLEEELIIRPTSETIIWSTYKNWIQSYRDLPLLINQWANVVRWEMRTRLFLRTAEFLWQEGHTIHETFDEAQRETMQMIEIYRKVCEEYLAIPMIVGQKSEKEKFAGAYATYTIEALMHDGQALQSGTSHNLGDHFAKAFEIKFLGRDNTEQYAYSTSWGVSTRLIGGIIMVHGDDSGLKLPPRIAPIQAVIVPIAQHKEGVLDHAYDLYNRLNETFRMEIDASDMNSPGWKFNQYEMKGVPVRIELGPKDIENGQCVMVRRDSGEKITVALTDVKETLARLLEEIQHAMYETALKAREAKTSVALNMDEFKQKLEQNPGFIKAMWCGSRECEDKIKEMTGASLRCIPFEQADLGSDQCVCCGEKTNKMAYFARAY